MEDEFAPRLRLVSTTTPPERREPDKLTAFLATLSEVSERYGIAISDGAELYEMDPDDRLFAYHADADSRLSRS